MSTAAQILANQANAQRSTGPGTEEGKARSARNNFRHGLASSQLIVIGEDPAEFEALAEGLFNEHQSATTTEENLVLSMAQHFWLGQRAIRLQNDAFAAGGSVSQLSLLLRYQTSNQRAYSRCLADLSKLRTERHRDEAAPLSELKTSRKDEAAHLSEPKTSRKVFERQKKLEAANRPPKPRAPYYIRNPKYVHMLLIDVPEAERFIKIDPNASKAQTGTATAAANGFESQNSSDKTAPSTELTIPANLSDSQIDPRAEKLIRELREIRLRLDQEEAAA